MAGESATAAATASAVMDSNGTPAPYGRACANCSRAKCRCIYRLDGNGCERCHRLKKDCRPSIPVRRRAAAAKKTGAGLSRTAQLEQKLDGLVELLAAQNSAVAAGRNAAGRGRNPDTEAPAAASESASTHPTTDKGQSTTLLKTAFALDGDPPVTAPQASSSPTPAGPIPVSLPLHLPRTPDSTSPSSSSIAAATNTAVHMCPGLERPEIASPEDQDLGLDPSIAPSEAEAEENLCAFRTGMLPYFPLVHIPPGVPAAHIRRARPVLWLAINCVACYRTTAEVQWARSTHLRRLLAQRLVVECRKSIDLLLAVLVFMAWIHYAAKREKPTLSIMSQVAISLLFDLGLHKMGTPCRSLVSRFVRFPYPHQDQDPPLPPAPLEDRRAALACYMLTSVLSIALRRIDSLRWTPRMEEHLHELAAHAETPLDHVLVVQVRLQRIADQMHHGDWQLWDPSMAHAGASGRRATADSHLLPPYVAQVLRAKINEVKASIPEEIRNHNGVLGTLHTVDTMLYASAVIPVPGGTGMHATPAGIPGASRTHAHVGGPTTGVSSTVDFARIASLERCVESIASFWEFFRHIPNDDFCSLPFAFFAYFTHCIMLLYALSMVDEPAWDRTAVRERLHVVDLLDGFANKLRSAPRHSSTTTDTTTTTTTTASAMESHDVFQRAARMVATVRDRWAADMSRANKAATAAGAADDVEAYTMGSAGGGGGAGTALVADLAASTAADLHNPWGPMASSQSRSMDPMHMVPGVPDTSGVAEAPTDLWGATDPLPMDADPMLQGAAAGQNMFFPDLLQVMGLSEDYLFMDSYMSMDPMM